MKFEQIQIQVAGATKTAYKMLVTGTRPCTIIGISSYMQNVDGDGRFISRDKAEELELKGQSVKSVERYIITTDETCFSYNGQKQNTKSVDVKFIDSLVKASGARGITDLSHALLTGAEIKGFVGVTEVPNKMLAYNAETGLAFQVNVADIAEGEPIEQTDFTLRNEWDYSSIAATFSKAIEAARIAYYTEQFRKEDAEKAERTTTRSRRNAALRASLITETPQGENDGGLDTKVKTGKKVGK